jgi:hypothetical protein
MLKNMQQTPLPNDHLQDLNLCTTYMIPVYDKLVTENRCNIFQSDYKLSTTSMIKNMQHSRLPNDHLQNLKTSTTNMIPEYDKLVTKRDVIFAITITK